MNKHDVLTRVAFYRDAPPELQARMLGAARHVNLSSGESLFREGEPADYFAAVGSGSIRVFRIGASGREITLYHARQGESSLVGILSVLVDRPPIATAQAEVESELVLIPAAALREWVAGSEVVRRFIFETMTRALVDVTELLEDVAFGRIERRLADLLLEHADEADMIRMRHEDISAELGTAREVVSRLLEGFERRGAISLSRGRIQVRDAQSLRRDTSH